MAYLGHFMDTLVSIRIATCLLNWPPESTEAPFGGFSLFFLTFNRNSGHFFKVIFTYILEGLKSSFYVYNVSELYGYKVKTI